MAPNIHRWKAAAMAAAVILVTTAGSAEDITTISPEQAHVRSSSPAIASLIAQATERSTTFRRLIAEINASDSYVYVNEGTCGHGVRACFVRVTASGPRRFMWVKVDTHTTDRDLMGCIGHELRHTLEVIADPSVRDDAAKFFLYERIGTHVNAGVRETRAAADAGSAVRWEVRTYDRGQKSE